MDRKSILLLTDMGSRNRPLPPPPIRGLLVPQPDLGTAGVHPLMSPAAPGSFFFKVFPDASCGAQGRASDRAAKGRWSESRYMDM